MIKRIIEKHSLLRGHIHLVQVVVHLELVQAHFLSEVLALVEAGEIQLLLYTFKNSLIEQL